MVLTQRKLAWMQMDNTMEFSDTDIDAAGTEVKNIIDATTFGAGGLSVTDITNALNEVG